MPLPAPEELPPEVRQLLPPGCRFDVPPQGESSFVLVARGDDDQAVVIKRGCGPLSAASLEREGKVLDALAASQLPLPRRLGSYGGQDVAWSVTTFLPGQTLWHRLHAEPEHRDRTRWFEALGELLARLHTTTVPSELEDRSATPWLDAQRRRRAARTPEPPSRWLERRKAAAPPAPDVRCLVHGDFTIDNVIVENGGLSGLIDVGAAGRGDPDYDIALALLPAPGVELGPTDVSAFLRGYGQSPLTEPLRTHFEALYGARGAGRSPAVGDPT